MSMYDAARLFNESGARRRSSVKVSLLRSCAIPRRLCRVRNDVESHRVPKSPRSQGIQSLRQPQRRQRPRRSTVLDIIPRPDQLQSAKGLGPLFCRLDTASFAGTLTRRLPGFSFLLISDHTLESFLVGSGGADSAFDARQIAYELLISSTIIARVPRKNADTERHTVKHLSHPFDGSTMLSRCWLLASSSASVPSAE